jgi:hypothetical protein
MHFEHLKKQQPMTNGNGFMKEAELVGQVEQPGLLETNPGPVAAQMPQPVSEPREAHYDICPECGQALLAREEGCAKCYGCGHAEC